ncbi:MAG: MaoC family dehydratase [Deltaproteobacteria bacterium]|nr:MaoC family dehydratase [Deltaproteobacteria bacterium]
MTETPDTRAAAPRGRFYEDFAVGQIIAHPRGRTVEAGDAILFTTSMMNTNPLYFNAHRAREAGHPAMVIDPLYVWNIVFGMTVEDLSFNVFGAGNLGYPTIEFVKAVYPGDTLYAESEVLDVTPWKKRDDCGVVHVRTIGTRPGGDVVLRYERKILVKKRGA